MINTAALALAFTAGLVATVNPCGFAMLPVYLGFFIGSDTGDASDRTGRMATALQVGGVVSLGFVTVFAAAGLLLNLGLQADLFASVLPWLTMGVGLGVTLLGFAMLWGYTPYIRIPGLRATRRERTMRSMFGFGVGYAVASLSCTLPVFLSLVTANFAQHSIVGGTLTFIVYGLGMATVLIAVTVGLALGRDTLLTRMRSAARHLDRVSGVILVAAGLFILWYWSTILSQGAVAAGERGLVRWVDERSAALTNLIGDHRRLLIASAVGLIGAALLYVAGRRALAPNSPTDPAAVGSDPHPE
jgi:cytochrome c biogenesis protein CcdA